MRRLALLYMAVIAVASTVCLDILAQDLPHEIYVEGGRHHVQGIALDREAGCMYFSFTDSFVKADLQGRVIGTVEHIQGHLGAMVFNPSDRKVYASLECKDDVIGRGLSDFAKGRSMFYVAIIDVDRVSSVGMDSEDNDAFRIVCIREATKDYHSKFYGCSGIDGVAIAPRIGKRGGRDYLYVAYGIYGDTSRDDNDCQVLLRYDFKDLNAHSGRVRFGEFYSEGPSRPLDKYFVFTGNTNWGVQNMAYDRSLGRMFLFVYKGAKDIFANYDAFSFDTSGKPSRKGLPGVTYDRSRHKVIGTGDNPVSGLFFKYGSTGVSPLGDGRFYFSENGRSEETGRQFSRVRLYRWDGKAFVPCED